MKRLQDYDSNLSRNQGQMQKWTMTPMVELMQLIEEAECLYLRLLGHPGTPHDKLWHAMRRANDRYQRRVNRLATAPPSGF